LSLNLRDGSHRSRSADASFDRLFCVNALHHFRDKRAFVVEARRVLRRGGRMMTIGRSWGS
jgi:ubiquinone/menaquinone biosynthesis C-methylase UbiE